MQEPDFVRPASDAPTALFSNLPATIAAAQSWYAGINPASAKEPAFQVNWPQAELVTLEKRQIILVPIDDRQDYFTSSKYRGFRYLVIQQSTTRQFNGVIIEVLAEANLYAQCKSLGTIAYAYLTRKKTLFPRDFTGMVLYYTANYQYLTGATIRAGVADRQAARLQLVPHLSSSLKSSTSFSSAVASAHATVYESCIDWYNANTGEPWGSTCTYETVPDPDGPSPEPGTGGTNGPGGGGWSGPATPMAPMNALLIRLQTNNMALYGPCPGLNNDWVPVIKHTVPYSVSQRLTNLSLVEQEIIFQRDWIVQALSTAGGAVINMDFFSVTLDKNHMPYVNGNSGLRFTPDQFLQYIRLNLNTLIDPNNPLFVPHPSLPGESTRWLTNPLGSILSINIIGNKGSVVVSGYGPDYWTFSTIHDPKYGDHPVSGNRTFGYRETAQGWEFYTRGADRIYSRPEELVGYLLSGKQTALQFIEGDLVWKNLQAGIGRFCAAHGGQSKINAPITNRPDWSQVEAALMQSEPNLQTVECP